jgi:hypothetical protein
MNKEITGSFRDPSGSVYYENNVLSRRINYCYKDNYDFLFSSGLYNELVSYGLMVSHIEAKNCESLAYKIIKPQVVPFISYPYEWCFSQLKEAALLTLRIQKLALKRGMSLKDCSAYNIQFIGPKPVFIDTLSFERYVKGIPWVAYRQFCQHFIAPLVLMGCVDIRLNQLFKSYIDGLPLDLAVALLPFLDRFNPGFLIHIYAHSKAHKYYSSVFPKKAATNPVKFSLNSFYGLIDSLESMIQKIKWKPVKTCWADYYDVGESYTSQAIVHKKQIVDKWISRVNPNMVCSLGANKGLFSRIASSKGIYTISSDFDPVCVEGSYLSALRNKEINILPLLLDISNPSPGIGWVNRERLSFVERGPFGLVTVLALIHHLAISNNLPLDKISDFLKQICKVLIIEFVPKDDEMVKQMFAFREDIFKDYTQKCFQNEFAKNFIIEEVTAIDDSKRTLYLMRRKD